LPGRQVGEGVNPTLDVFGSVQFNRENERHFYQMTESQHEKEDRQKAMEESRENTIRLDAIYYAAIGVGLVWSLFNGLMDGSVELLEQFMARGLALTYTAVAGIGFILLVGNRATTGKVWFERFSLTEDLWRSSFSSILYGLVFYILLVHAFIIPVASIFYFMDNNVTSWISVPFSIGGTIGYVFTVIKLLDVFAKWLRVKGAW
jgi:hypothetical protein